MEDVMKLVKRKTRKAIEKSVRKALKKHGPALVAGLVSGLASAVAALAKTDARDARGTSNRGSVIDGARASVADDGGKKARLRGSEA
jgi:hypothetical protein